MRAAVIGLAAPSAAAVYRASGPMAPNGHAAEVCACLLRLPVVEGCTDLVQGAPPKSTQPGHGRATLL
jgi:hypothetical protein